MNTEIKQSKKQIALKALTCLYAEAPKSVADQVKSAVLAAFDEIAGSEGDKIVVSKMEIQEKIRKCQEWVDDNPGRVDGQMHMTKAAIGVWEDIIKPTA